MLKQHGVKLDSAAALVARLRQALGAALIRAGQRVAGVPRGVASSETVPATGTLGPVG